MPDLTVPMLLRLLHDAAAGVPLRAETLTPGEQPYLCVGYGTIGPGNVPCLNCAPAPSAPAPGEGDGMDPLLEAISGIMVAAATGDGLALAACRGRAREQIAALRARVAAVERERAAAQEV